MRHDLTPSVKPGGPGQRLAALAAQGAPRYMAVGTIARQTPETFVTDALAAAPASGLEEADPPAHFRAHVFVCCNRRPDGHRRGSCAAKGSEELRDYMKARAKELGLRGVRVNMAGCLDRCEFGPTLVIYPEGIWYSPRTRADIDEILEAHLVQGGRCRRLMLTERDVLPAKG